MSRTRSSPGQNPLAFCFGHTSLDYAAPIDISHGLSVLKFPGNSLSMKIHLFMQCVASIMMARISNRDSSECARVLQGRVSNLRLSEVIVFLTDKKMCRDPMQGCRVPVARIRSASNEKRAGMEIPAAQVADSSRSITRCLVGMGT
jgi:hypothetical protein